MAWTNWRRLLVTTWPLIGIILIGCSVTSEPQFPTCENEWRIKGESLNVACDDPRAPNDLPPRGW